ncbi:MAG: hypothetical protein HY855_19115 [Burkholderiales bacterium]|nr:hypothetical protein [Burkholderiales bacterium]
MFQRFTPLLQREWMQHQRGWLVLLLAPLVLILLASTFAPIGMQVEIDGDTVVQRTPVAGVQALVSVLGMAVLTLMLALLSSWFQAPGLARRDRQDRSIEFWLSLPIGHVQSLSATLLMHLLLLPWLALVAGAIGGVLVSLVVVAKSWGISAWFGLPWVGLLLGSGALLLRLAVGVLLAVLWLSPLILLLMAASAWLKRWGVPLVVGTLAAGGVVLQQLYDNRVIGDLLLGLLDNASRALIAADRSDQDKKLLVGMDSGAVDVLGRLPAWAMRDLADALHALLSPHFAAALVGAALCFGLLVLRRQRGS